MKARAHLGWIPTATLAPVILLFVSCGRGQPTQSYTPGLGEIERPKRYYADGTFTSTGLPEITIRFDAQLTYVGQTEFTLRGVAEVDRHHLVDADSTGRIKRLVVLHFEGWLNEQTYNYRIPQELRGADAQFSSELVRLGEHDYIHNTWFFDAQRNVAENPEAELARTRKLLEERGYDFPAEIMMSRFVRVVDAERKHEFILFYIEPLSRTGFRASDFRRGGAGAEEVERLSAELTARSREAFIITGG
jgi:hypothetical protein